MPYVLWLYIVVGWISSSLAVWFIARTSFPTKADVPRTACIVGGLMTLFWPLVIVLVLYALVMHLIKRHPNP